MSSTTVQKDIKTLLTRQEFLQKSINTLNSELLQVQSQIRRIKYDYTEYSKLINKIDEFIELHHLHMFELEEHNEEVHRVFADGKHEYRDLIEFKWRVVHTKLTLSDKLSERLSDDHKLSGFFHESQQPASNGSTNCYNYTTMTYDRAKELRNLMELLFAININE
jgi:chromosome segregation ATPase